MKLTEFGALQISVTPRAGSEILSVDIAAQNRKDPVHMETAKDETVDQFVSRVRSMLRSLYNNVPRESSKPENPAKETGPKTWEEQKSTMTGGKTK